MSRSEAPLRLELRASRGFGLGLALLAVLAVGALLLADLPLSIAMVAAVGAVLLAARVWRQHAVLAGTALRLDADGTLRWRNATGTDSSGRLSQHTLLGPLITLEAIDEARQRTRFALWQDMLDADAWRRLRVDLVHRGKADSYKA